MSRYLNPSALVAVRYLAEETIRRRRPRRAARVRAYAPGRHRRPVPLARAPRIDVLTRALAGLQALEVRAA